MIIHANILDWAESYDGPKFHALLCDAPYHLTEITDRFGDEDAAPAQYGRDGAFQRMSKGFMGKSWDGVGKDGIGIAFNPETWKALARHLHPGAYLFVFAGTLNDDLISMAMRQAGLRKHHKALAWGYGSGFPKATNIANQIDAAAFRVWLAAHPRESTILKSIEHVARAARKARQPYKALEARTKRATQMLKRRAGLLPQVVERRKHQPKFAAKDFGYREKDNGYNSRERESFDVTAPATELAAIWQGHRYGQQALKPAVEPILIFQKPYEKNAVRCITQTGAGGLNVDQGRIDGPARPLPAQRPRGMGFGGGTDNGPCEAIESEHGRWPANLILSHHSECEQVGARRVSHPSRGARGGKQHPRPRSATATIYGKDDRTTPTPAYGDADGYETISEWYCAPGCPVAALGAQSGERPAGSSKTGLEPSPVTSGIYGERNRVPFTGHDDSGTAARFFFNADYLYERLEAADAVIYEAKASQSEREAGLDPRQIALLDMAAIDGGRDGRIVGRQFAHDTINDGREIPIDNPYQRGKTTRRNLHPTIKPIALARYLATLLLPPVPYASRRLLIPFAGAGSEVIGAMLAGWEEVVGVELEADHVAIAEARLAYWRQRLHEFGDRAKEVRAALNEAPAGQLDMFEVTP